MSKLITVPFDLSKAKQITNGEIEGKIVTRDGRSVRIVCFDRKSKFPIIALIENGEIENYGLYYIDGRINDDKDYITQGDLFLKLPEYLTFKDGDVLYCNGAFEWVFIYRKGAYITNYYTALCKYDSALSFGDNNLMPNNIITEIRFATNSEKQKLIKALQESTAPRAVDCLKKLGVEVKPKCEFTAGQPVIGIDGRGEWRYDLFSHYKPEQLNGVYVCTGRSYKHCLPYEGNEHLLETTKNI